MNSSRTTYSLTEDRDSQNKRLIEYMFQKLSREIARIELYQQKNCHDVIFDSGFNAVVTAWSILDYFADIKGLKPKEFRTTFINNHSQENFGLIHDVANLYKHMTISSPQGNDIQDAIVVTTSVASCSYGDDLHPVKEKKLKFNDIRAVDLLADMYKYLLKYALDNGIVDCNPVALS